MIQTYWRHCGGGWCAAAVAARIVVRGAVTRTVVVVVGIVLSSCSVLRRSHYVVGLRKVLSRSWLRSVSESQAGRVDDAIVSYKRHGHLGGLTNL